MLIKDSIHLHSIWDFGEKGFRDTVEPPVMGYLNDWHHVKFGNVSSGEGVFVCNFWLSWNLHTENNLGLNSHLTRRLASFEIIRY